MATMGRGASDPMQIKRFFASVVVPPARSSRATAVLYHAGPLRAAVVQAIRGSCNAHGVACFSKFDVVDPATVDALLPFERPAQSLLHADVLVRPTKAAHAATDVLLMDAAAAVLVTAYSSLTSLVVSRRCCRDHVDSGGNSSVWMYDVLPNGSFTDTAAYICGTSLPPYLVGGGLATPPRSLDVFRPSFDPASPLARRGV